MRTFEQLQVLPANERLQLAVDLWESIENDASVSLDVQQLRELDCRIDLLEADPKRGISWMTVRDSILATL